MKVFKKLVWLAIYGTIFILSQIVTSFILARLYLWQYSSSAIKSMETFLLENTGLILILSGLFIFIFGFLVLLLRGKQPLAYLQFRRMSRPDALAMLPLGIGFSLFLTCLLTLTRFNSLIPDVVSDPLAEALNINLPLMLLAIGLVVPFYEEFVFRGLIFQELNQGKRSPLMAILISALLFGAFHLNWFQFVYTVPAGILLALVASRYRSIWAPILIHLSWNTTSIVFSGLLPAETRVRTLIVFMLLGGGLLAASLYYIFKIRPRPRFDQEFELTPPINEV